MNQKWENLDKLIEYSKDGILSKVLIDTKKNNITLFCMAKGTEISDHTSTKEGFIFVVEGKGTFNLKGENIPMLPKVFIFLPKNAVHSVKAKENMTFLLSLNS